MTGTGGWGLGALGSGLAIALALLASGPTQAGHDLPDAADDAVRRQLAGEWTLVKYEVFPETGPTRSGNYDIGRISYGEREMSAHLMRSGRAKDTATTDTARAVAFQGYLGYFGPYTVDAAKKIVVHHVAGSSLPNWLGSEQVRHYGFSADGKQLTLSLKSGDRITQTLTWERTGR